MRDAVGQGSAPPFASSGAWFGGHFSYANGFPQLIIKFLSIAESKNMNQVLCDQMKVCILRCF